jgi:nucleoside diphosphate kinase
MAFKPVCFNLFILYICRIQASALIILKFITQFYLFCIFININEPLFNCFNGELIEHITSGPVVIMALARDNAILAWRDLMGSTNPADAAEGTIRKKFGQNIGNNAVHGSDAPQTAMQELGMFFPEFFEEPK